MEYQTDVRELAWAFFLRFCLLFSFVLGGLAIYLHLPSIQYSVLSHPLSSSSWPVVSLLLLLVVCAIIMTQHFRYLISQSLRIDKSGLKWTSQRGKVTIQSEEISNIHFFYRHNILHRICIHLRGRRLIQLHHFCDIDALAQQLQQLVQDRPDVVVGHKRD